MPIVMDMWYKAAMAIVWTQAEIDKLKASIARGVLSVSFGDETTTFQSLAEMRKLLADMERSLSSPPAYRLAATSKGV